jgi:hypothetical protein
MEMVSISLPCREMQCISRETTWLVAFQLSPEMLLRRLRFRRFQAEEETIEAI